MKETALTSLTQPQSLEIVCPKIQPKQLNEREGFTEVPQTQETTQLATPADVPVYKVEIKGESGTHTGRWTPEEKAMFLAGLKEHGDDWTTVQKMIPTRTRKQVVSHAQKHYDKQRKFQIKQNRKATGPNRKLFAIVRYHRNLKKLRIKPQYEIILDDIPPQNRAAPHTPLRPQLQVRTQPPLQSISGPSARDDRSQLGMTNVHLNLTQGQTQATARTAMQTGTVGEMNIPEFPRADPLAFLDGWTPGMQSASRTGLQLSMMERARRAHHGLGHIPAASPL